MTLKALRTADPVFCRMSQLGFILFFLMTTLGLYFFWEEDHTSKGHFTALYQGCTLSTWLVTVSANLDYLAEVVFVRFLHCKVILFPSFHTVLFGRKAPWHRPCLKNGELSIAKLRVEYLHQLFGILHGRFVSRLDFFIC